MKSRFDYKTSLQVWDNSFLRSDAVLTHRFLKNGFALIIICLFLSTTLAQAHNYNKTKTFAKSYGISDMATIELDNKYGNIHIDTWDKDSISLDVNIEVRGKSMSKVEAMLARIEIETSGNSDFVNIRTEIVKQSQGIFARFLRNTLDFTQNLLDNQSVTVEYNILLPASVKLILQNKYGDVYLPTINGYVRIDMQHGNFRAETINEGRNINVKYGDVNIDHITEGNLDISYGDLMIASADNIHIKSRAIDGHLEKVNSLDLDTRNDKYFIDDAEKIVGETQFSTIHVARLGKYLNVESRYGDLKINNISSNFAGVNCYGTNTDYYLNFDARTALTFDMTLEGSDLNYPSKYVSIQEDEQIDKIRNISGKMGASEGNQELSNVRLRCKSGSVWMGYD